MQAAQLDQIADRASARYKLLLAGFSNLYHQGLQDPSVQRSVIPRAYMLAQSYMSNEAQHLTADTQDVLHDSMQATMVALAGVPHVEIPEEQSDNAYSIVEDLEKSLRVQLERDIASLARGQRLQALRASLSGKARGISGRMAQAQLASDSDLSFTYIDRAERNWPSQKLVRSVYRQAMVYVWNETALLTLADHAQDHALINHPDASHEFAGATIALGETPGADDLTWSQVRESVFHPNTSAWIGVNYITHG